MRIAIAANLSSMSSLAEVNRIRVSVRGTNTCRIAIHRPHGADMLVVISVIDNLAKGASGQAVQNMNIMFGFEETMGLSELPVVPDPAGEI